MYSGIPQWLPHKAKYDAFLNILEYCQLKSLITFKWFKTEA